MSAFLEAYPEGSGRGAMAPEPGERIDAIRLVAGVPEIHPAPAGFRYAVFSFTSDVFVRFGDSEATAAIPLASSADGAAAELNPAARRIPDGATHIALVAVASCVGSISFYR